MTGDAVEQLRERFRASGPLRFDEFMEIALYGEGGFFTKSAAGAGRHGDFVTSVTIGRLFAEVLARRIWDWADQHALRPVRVADAGGGGASLAGVLRAAGLDCVVVDRSEPARRRAADGGIPCVSALGDLPWRPDVVVAHELLDNLPARLMQDGERELRVGFDDAGTCLHHVPLDEELRTFRDSWPGAGESVVAVPVGALEWVSQVVATMAPEGLVLLVDYGEDIADLAVRDDWPVRGYRDQREVDPIAAPGETDVTCDVPVDVIASALESGGFTVQRERQAGWLNRWGLAADVATARRAAVEAARAGDTAGQLEARSAEAEAMDLTAAEGLGAFWVIEAERVRA